jgi:tetratricopeptide (TPR) repeat protein
MKQVVSKMYLSNRDAGRCYRESLELWRQAGDKRGIALSLGWLGLNLEYLGDRATTAEMTVHLEDSIAAARETGDPWTIAWSLRLAYSMRDRKDRDLSFRQAALEEAVSLAEKTGDPFLVCQTRLGMGMVLSWAEEWSAAEPLLLEALRIARTIDDKWSIFDCLNNVAGNYFRWNRLGDARRYYGEGMHTALDLGALGFLHYYIGGFDWIARTEGRMERAARLRAAAIRIAVGRTDYYSDSVGPPLVLDEETARRQWAIGQSMPLEEVIAYAISDED